MGHGPGVPIINGGSGGGVADGGGIIFAVTMHFRYLNKAVLNVSIKKQLPYKTSHAVRSGYAAVRKLKRNVQRRIGRPIGKIKIRNPPIHTGRAIGSVDGLFQGGAPEVTLWLCRREESHVLVSVQLHGLHRLLHSVEVRVTQAGEVGFLQQRLFQGFSK